jgi:hypothetical protein
MVSSKIRRAKLPGRCYWVEEPSTASKADYRFAAKRLFTLALQTVAFQYCRPNDRPREPPDQTSRPESPAIARMPDQRGCNGKPLCQPSQPPHEYGPRIRPRMVRIKKLVLRDPVGVPSSCCTTKSGHIGLWTKMRRSGGQLNGPESLLQFRSLADFVTTTGFRYIQPSFFVSV